MDNCNKLFLLVFFAASLTFLGSCSDDETSVETTPREEMLQMLAGEQSKSWMLSTIHLNGFDATSNLLDECNLDDLYVFHQNGEGEVLSNEDKCMDEEPDQLGTGSWELHEDLVTLSLQLPPFFDEEVEILELTEDRLQLRQEEEDETIVVTYIAAE